MKSYSPFHIDPRKAQDSPIDSAPQGYAPPTDYDLKHYVEHYWQEYRAAVERYFGEVSSSLPIKANEQYHSVIVRIGPNGVIIGHKLAEVRSIEILRIEDFEPPLEDFNIFTIQKRLNTPLVSFDFTYRHYNEATAREAGARAAFEQARSVFWRVLEPMRFEALCCELAVAEGVRLGSSERADIGYNLIGRVYLDEPGQFVREETWGFVLKHFKVERPSTSLIRKLESELDHSNRPIDVLCLVSSGDLTSIGRNVAIKNPRLRVWDRAVLDVLLHRNAEVMARYFEPYAHALERLESDLSLTHSASARFDAALRDCPSGQRHFREYEDIGVEILRYLFPLELGDLRLQVRTEDGVERRDVVARNNRHSRFFQRINERFHADFIIWDFKNYEAPVSGEVINDVATYASPALGRFIVVISRMGGNEAARAAQLRRLRNDQRMIVVVSDQQLLEMVQRKETGETAADLLEDLMDEQLLAY